MRQETAALGMLKICVSHIKSSDGPSWKQSRGSGFKPQGLVFRVWPKRCDDSIQIQTECQHVGLGGWGSWNVEILCHSHQYFICDNLKIKTRVRVYILGLGVQSLADEMSSIHADLNFMPTRWLLGMLNICVSHFKSLHISFLPSLSLSLSLSLSICVIDDHPFQVTVEPFFKKNHKQSGDAGGKF